MTETVEKLRPPSQPLLALQVPTHRRRCGKVLDPDRRTSDAAYIRAQLCRQFARAGMSAPSWVSKMYGG